ncbi:MAG: SMC family ATPase, partial [Bacteroidota bacterium]
MIPKHLSIQGLYSYQGRHDIDFEPLTTAQLFGIFGATGSGKSSILEAISYALYGESERLNKRDNRAYNMMNLRSQRMFISFEFEVNEQRYKFEAQAKRNSKRFDDVTLLPRKAYKLEDEQWLPIEVETAKELTGLSYQNFRRTIIIPQGKFQEFLQLTDTDRVRMLKEIFQLEKYELFHKAVSLERKNQDKINHCETLLLQLEAITPERIKELETQLEELEAAYQLQETQLQGKRKQLAELEEQKLKLDRLQKQRILVRGLLDQEALFQKREQTLKQYEYCVTHLNPLLIKQKEIRSQAEDIQRQKGLKEVQLEKDKDLLKHAESNFERIQEQYLNRESILQKAKELEQLSGIQELERILGDKQERIDKGQKLIEEEKATQQNLQKELMELEAEWEKLQKGKPDLKELMQWKDWLHKLDSLETEHKRIGKEVEMAEGQLEEVKSVKRTLLKESPLEVGQYMLEIPQILPILTQGLSRLDEDVKEARKELSLQQAQAHLLELSAQLVDGEPCPLCGSVHHPDPMREKLGDGQEHKLEEKLTAITAQREKQQKIYLQLEQLESRIQEKSLELEKLSAKKEEAQLAIHSHESQEKSLIGDKSPEEVRQLILQQSKTDEQSLKISQSRSSKQELFHDLQQKLDRYSERLDVLRKEYQETDVAFQSGTMSLQKLDYDAYRQVSAEQIQVEQDKLENEYAQLNTLFAQADERVKKLRSGIDSLSGELETLTEQESKLTKALAEGHQQLDKAVSEAGYENASSVERILNLALDISGEREAISSFRQELHQSQGMLEELETQTKGIKLDAASYDSLVEEIQQKEQAQKEQTKQIGATQQEIARTNNQLEEKQKLQQEREQLGLRAEDIKILKSLFARSGFVNYVSTMYLRQLCEAANHRFTKLTRGSLRL